MDILQIGCPDCGAVFNVSNQPGVERMIATCPVCKNKHLFTDFKTMAGREGEDSTQYPSDRKTSGVGNGSEEKTEVYIGINTGIGRLVMTGSKVYYQLHMGRNVVGRQASSSSATIQIPDPDKRMSREQIIIDVRKEKGKGITHYAKLYKEKVNATFISGERLEYGDVVILNDGDIIKLPDANMRFELTPERDSAY